MRIDTASTDPNRIDEQTLVTRAKRQDLRFALVGFAVLVTAMVTLLALVLDFVADGVPRISVDFLLNYPSRRPDQAGILSAWVGTSLVMLTTAALAVPMGVAAGVYLEEYAPKNWLTDIIEINVTNLAGVPSIIYGLLALGLFVQTLRMGQTILVAGMTLALLILPIVIVATREALRGIPLETREAAYGVGAEAVGRGLADRLAVPEEEAHALLLRAVADDGVLAQEPDRAPVPHLRRGLGERGLDQLAQALAHRADRGLLLARVRGDPSLVSGLPDLP